MAIAGVYVKTPKGIEEVSQRTHGLGQRARRILIMVDGKRDADQLGGLFPAEDVAGILASLVGDGFLTPLEAPKADQAPPPPDDEKRFQMARNFMMNTVNAFVGIAASSFISQLENAPDLESLRQRYADWQAALRLSRDGRKQLPDLEKKLAALIS
ncbi:MAG: hypothetical protein JNK22_00055 [Rhodocyclaceae bacterium]|nr:hypothetical protein [Rhodocyclaceae bacterium]